MKTCFLVILSTIRLCEDYNKKLDEGLYKDIKNSNSVFGVERIGYEDINGQ